MELKLEDKRILQIYIEHDLVHDYDEISPFISMMEKLVAKSKKQGFIREFSSNERIVINGIWDQLKQYVPDKTGNNQGVSGKV